MSIPLLFYSASFPYKTHHNLSLDLNSPSDDKIKQSLRCWSPSKKGASIACVKDGGRVDFVAYVDETIDQRGVEASIQKVAEMAVDYNADKQEQSPDMRRAVYALGLFVDGQGPLYTK
ncbi:hypothetical protein L1987_47867 [Smallanthus sonchifolius]|uniref:Uncharacterized protein n=1 Tax=Smallanthus sonchifolius TaxID=185202 RepID=A0ACB9FQ82_9ASTR|nr:hypothetical protein L1987_47867 [Smallanthus sonchifolius]